jgi:hypothetical protein
VFGHERILRPIDRGQLNGDPGGREEPMSKTRYNAASWAVGKKRGEPMREPEDVSAMLRLHELGWGRSGLLLSLG